MMDESIREIHEEIKRFGGLPMKHDTFFRETFDMFEIGKEFLQYAIPQKMSQNFDFGKLTQESKDFMNEVFRDTHADKVYRISMRKIGNKNNKIDETVRGFIVLEHKSYNDPHTMLQTHRYSEQIAEQEIRLAEKKERFDSQFRFSPVLIIVFYHGPEPFSWPWDVKYSYEHEFLEDEFLTRQGAIVVDFFILGDKIPYNPDAPEFYAVVRVMQKIHGPEIIPCACEVFDRLEPFAKRPTYRRLIRYIYYYVICSGKGITKADVDIVTEKVKTIIGDRQVSTILEEFRAEGEARGEIKREAKLLLRYLSRMGTVSEALTVKIYSISDLDELDRLTDIAWDCRSVDEFEKHLL